VSCSRGSRRSPACSAPASRRRTFAVRAWLKPDPWRAQRQPAQGCARPGRNKPPGGRGQRHKASLVAVEPQRLHGPFVGRGPSKRLVSGAGRGAGAPRKSRRRGASRRLLDQDCACRRQAVVRRNLGAAQRQRARRIRRGARGAGPDPGGSRPECRGRPSTTPRRTSRNAVHEVRHRCSRTGLIVIVVNLYSLGSLRTGDGAARGDSGLADGHGLS